MTARKRVWTVVCAVATVVLGPAAVTASALDQANGAPMHHTVKVDPARTQAQTKAQTQAQTQAYLPSAPDRRRTAAA
ncbi:hypothetical protein AB5J55_11495 [Streptomyces sp. R11]|uniref:Secreted protein n=1 Tax=Streptomyces sp. R11 TaxID=3238625 RepID=A0AB39NE77_9ACTN